MITREEFDTEWNKIDIIEGCTIGYHCGQTDELVDKYINQLEQHIKSLEAQLANAEHRKNPKIIRKGQTFHDERNGQVTFLGIDSYCGELSAILVCSDGRKKYPLLANMPEFNFIDN